MIPLKILIWGFLATIASAKFYTPECSGFGYSCLDCHTQKFCIGNVLMSNSTCQPGRNIFCDPRDGLCKPKPHPDCEAEGNECPRRDGVFPNLHNCTKYVRCKNNSAEDIVCPSRHVYSQQLGKCVLKLENSNCFEPKCGFIPAIQRYPGDASLYYECIGGTANLRACPEYSTYNVTTKLCDSICTNGSLLANPRNCLEYISCEASGPTKKSCPDGYGFNPVLAKCQKGLNQLCYEISVFDRDLINLLVLPDFIKNIIRQIMQLLARFDIDYSTLLKYGVPAEFISAILLIGDYILTHGLRPPPLLLNYILELVLPLVPANLRATIQMILYFLFGMSIR